VRCGGRARAGLLVVWRGERQPQRWVEGQQEARPRRVGVRCENATGDSGRCDESTVKARQSKRCLWRRRVVYANCIPWAADTVLSCGARPTSREWLGELQMYGYGAVLFLITPPLPRTHAGRIVNCSPRMHVQGSITQGRSWIGTDTFDVCQNARCTTLALSLELWPIASNTTPS
jgi:hypothetical protein